MWIKIELPNVHDEEVHLDPNGALHFYGKSELKGNHCYKLHLDLFSTINTEVSLFFLWADLTNDFVAKYLAKERMERTFYHH